MKMNKSIKAASILFFILSSFAFTVCTSYSSYLKEGKKYEESGDYEKAISTYDDGIRDINENSNIKYIGQDTAVGRSLYGQLTDLQNAKRNAEEAQQKAILEKAPSLISLTEFENDYQKRLAGNYILHVKIDYSNDTFLQDQTIFVVNNLLFQDQTIKSKYILRKPDIDYELNVTLKGLDNFDIYLNDITGNLFTESDKVAYDNKIAEEKRIETERLNAERLAKEKAEADRIEAERLAKQKADQVRMSKFIFKPNDFSVEDISKYKKIDLFEAVASVDKMVRGSGSFGDTLFGELLSSDSQLGALSNIQYYVSEVLFVSQSGTNIKFKTADNAIAQDMKISNRSGLSPGQKVNLYYRVSKNPLTEWNVIAIEKP